MAENGKLSPSELAPIEGGELAIPAAAAWRAPHGPESAGLKPTGPISSYRSFAEQLKTWAIYLAGGNLAAKPGYSNHGWGLCVDLAEEWMRSWIDDHGAKFGWKKTEAFSEWWHVNFVGGVSFKLFNTLAHGDRGKRVAWYTKRLAFIRSGAHGHPAYLKRSYLKYKTDVVAAVKKFQGDHGLKQTGQIDEVTAHTISATFHQQYVARKGKRKRKARDIVRRRP